MCKGGLLLHNGVTSTEVLRMGAELKRWKGYFEISVFLFLAALTGTVYTHYYRVGSDEEINDLEVASKQKFITKGITRSAPEEIEIYLTSPCLDDNQRQCKYKSKGAVDNVDPRVMTGMFMKHILLILQARESVNA